MNGLIPFQFGGDQIRVIDIDGEPYFVGRDVCSALGYTNPSKAMGDHCKGVTKRYPLATAGGEQEIRVLNEANVIRLIVSSSLPAAERFESWIFDEVIPTIRKTGSYGHADPMAVLSDPAAMRTLLLGYSEKVLKLESKVEEMRPAVTAFDRIAGADGSLTLRACAKLLQMPERKLAQWMHEQSWLYRGPKGGWMGYADKTKAGLLTHKVNTYHDEQAGEDKVSMQVRLTLRGVGRIAKLLGVQVSQDDLGVALRNGDMQGAERSKAA